MLHDDNLVYPDLLGLTSPRRHVRAQWEAEPPICGGKLHNSLSCWPYVCNACKGPEKRSVFQRGIHPILTGPLMKKVFPSLCRSLPFKAVFRHLPVELKHAQISATD